MQILITGGTGFIGRALCARLLEQGHQLTVISRQTPERVRAICGEAVSALPGLRALSPAASFDAVINLAGEPIAASRWTEARKTVLWQSRVELTEELLGFIARAERKPGVLLSGSAVGFYGDRGDETLDESASGRDEFSHRLCAAWEAAALRAVDLGVRVAILRTGLVIGPGGGFLQRLLPPFRFGLGGRLGTGRQWMSWIHRDDHLAMLEQLLVNPRLEGVFNGTAPHPVTNAEFTACLAKVLGRPALFPVPAALLRLILGEMSQLLLGGQRVLPARFQHEGFRFRYETLEEALRSVIAGKA